MANRRKLVKKNTVRIGKKIIPVVIGFTKAIFSAGRQGEMEKGAYNFWTAVYLDRKNVKEIYGRARTKLDAGDRFRRMEKEMKLKTNSAAGRREYGRMWALLKNVVYVRPATWEEVCRWLLSHEDDAEYIKSITFK